MYVKLIRIKVGTMIQDYWHGPRGNWTDFTFVLSTCNKLFIDEKNIWIIFWSFTKGGTIDPTIPVIFYLAWNLIKRAWNHICIFDISILPLAHFGLGHCEMKEDQNSTDVIVIELKVSNSS